MTGKPDDIIRWLLNQDRSKLFDIKPHREKRSLTANAYAWALIGKIADAVNASKDEVYLIMLKRYGQSQIVSVLSSVSVDGFFKYYEPVSDSWLEGLRFTHYRVYKGSSEYDSKEMSVLIDGIVSEAEDLEIETLPPHEIQRLKEMWRC